MHGMYRWVRTAFPDLALGADATSALADEFVRGPGSTLSQCGGPRPNEAASICSSSVCECAWLTLMSSICGTNSPAGVQWDVN